MNAKVNRSLLRDKVEDNGRKQNWSDELKGLVGSLIDLAAEMIGTNRETLGLHEILTLDELANRLKVPRSTLEELARKGKIPGAFRLGKHWRFDMDALRAGLQKNGIQDIDK